MTTQRDQGLPRDLEERLGTLRALISRQFNVRTQREAISLTLTVATTATQVLKNNPNRLAFILVNLSANVGYFAPVQTVSSSAGIRAAASGGSFAFIWNEDFDLVALEWFAINDTLAGTWLRLGVEGAP